jgi:hypothetical protein
MLRTWTKALVAAAALLGAGAAEAQRYGGDLRIEAGGTAFFDPYSYGAFTLGADYDLALGRIAHLGMGARVMLGDGEGRVLFEPSLAVVWKFGGLRAPVVPRLQLGLGLYAGSYFGAMVRFGGGLAFLLSRRVDLGFDVVVEAGVLGRRGTGDAQFTFGPEFRL